MNASIKPKYYITVSLSEEIKKLARNFSSQQLDHENRQKVFLNTLAVYAVHTYLKRGDIETDLDKSSSWHPIDRALFDVSDLYVPHLEVSIECCPVKSNQKIVNLTSNALDKAILGYVAVQFLETLDEVRLVGYLSGDKIDDKLSELPLDEFEHVSKIVDDFFVLEENILIFKEKLDQIQDEEIKLYLEKTLIDNNDNKIARSILEKRKKASRKWAREETDKLKELILEQQFNKVLNSEENQLISHRESFKKDDIYELNNQEVFGKIDVNVQKKLENWFRQLSEEFMSEEDLENI